jgi:hypothetical protein
VGGVGVMGDGVYGSDANILDIDDNDPEEYIALAGTRGFEAPEHDHRRQDHGRWHVAALSDAVAGLMSSGSVSFASRSTARGQSRCGAIIGYANAAVLAGAAYGTEASGIRGIDRSRIFEPRRRCPHRRQRANRYPDARRHRRGRRTARR